MSNPVENITAPEVTSVADVYAAHKEALDTIVKLGMEYELVDLPEVPLPFPVTVEEGDRTLTHMTASIFAVGGDYPDLEFRGGPDGRDVEVSPQISVKLTEGPDKDGEGFVTIFNYEDISFVDHDFVGGTPDISTRLDPESFAVHYGHHMTEHNMELSGADRAVGGVNDKGYYARIAGKSLTALAVVYGDVAAQGYEAAMVYNLEAK